MPLDDATLPAWIAGLGLCADPADLALGPAGDGNINWLRRVRDTRTGRSWVVKHARPALERFPQYTAPTERLLFEWRYLATAVGLGLGANCPHVVHFDPVHPVLVLEDLGAAPTLAETLERQRDVVEILRAIGRFLGIVHGATGDPHLAASFANGAMQRLHGDHVFALPFAPNDFPLSPAVRARAEAVWNDAALVRTAAAAYRRYREPRGALLHADVQGGNVLVVDGVPRILDAEIAHVGDPAFDVGIVVAHLLVPRLAGTAGATGVSALWDAYRGAHRGTAPDFADVARHAAIEVMRRTIGAARLAALTDDTIAVRAVAFASRLMLAPSTEPGALETL